MDQKTSPAAEKLHHEVPKWILPDYLRSLVKAHLADGSLKIDELAEIAGISKRSLQRNLTENCSSFSQIMQEARFETACMHLDNLSMKIKDVAAALGYANSTHFSRYFRRHSGISPRQYRSQKQYDV
ncbi:MAG: helix-turn-helix transcriptional regulator [Hellea sp.]|nr:helix-turn-helix transcriptional regulator [Hellea sp.]